MAYDLPRACLEQAGATFPYGPAFPALPLGADAGTWDDCVAATKQAVDTQFAAWGGRLVQHSDSATTNGDSAPTTAP